jgi:hypothetical protein
MTSISNGEESQVLTSVTNRAFSLVNEGIYFIPERPPARTAPRDCCHNFCVLEAGEDVDRILTVDARECRPSKNRLSNSCKRDETLWPDSLILLT